MADEFLTADELADWLRIKRKSVYSLPIPRQPVGRRVRYRRADVERYLRAQEARAILRRRAVA